MAPYAACGEPQSKHPNAGEMINLASGLEKVFAFSQQSFLLPQSGFSTSVFPLASLPQPALSSCVLLDRAVGATDNSIMLQAQMLEQKLSGSYGTVFLVIMFASSFF